MKRLVTFAAAVLLVLTAPFASAHEIGHKLGVWDHVQAREFKLPAVVINVKAAKPSVRTLADMIKAGHYDVVDASINKKLFKVKPQRFTTQGIKVVHFGQEISTEEAIYELYLLKLRPATIEHLLAYGAEHPEAQRAHEIAALGSGYYSNRPQRWLMVPTLGTYPTGQRVLGYNWGVAPNHKWNKETRFLAFPK